MAALSPTAIIVEITPSPELLELCKGLEALKPDKAPLRAPLTPDQIADLKSRLHLTRMEFRSMGREMDIADIVEVVQKFDLHHSAT